MITFGKNLGAYKRGHFVAENHCELLLDGVVMGKIFKLKNSYEYRGKPLGTHGLEWVARSDQRDLMEAIDASMKAKG